MDENKLKEKKILNLITQIFIVFIIIIFPLLVDNTGFFKILEFKWKVFFYVSISYILTVCFVLLYFLLFKNLRYLKSIKFEKIQWIVLLLLAINITSVIFSPYLKKYNLLIGVGRGEGLVNIFLYITIFLSITIFADFNKKHILYFSVISIIENLICILQYVGLNPFNMYQNGIGTHNVSFMGTIGNVDFISAFICITATISFMAFVFLDDNKWTKIAHLASIIMSSFVFQIISVNSGRVALFITLLLVLPFIVTSSKRLYRTLIVGAGILFGYFVNITMNIKYYYSIQSLKCNFQINYISISILICLVIFLILAYILKKNEYNISNNKRVIIGIYSLFIICILIVVLAIYFCNFNFGMIKELHEMLHGNFKDEYGTYRIFLWRRAILLVKDNPLIGTGPDTFAIRFMSRYSNDIKALGHSTIQDTAANVYITTAVNIGISGLICYLTFILLQIKKGIKEKNDISIVLLIGIICYLIQDFFNISVVMVTPVFWTLMALYIISLKNVEKNN